MRRFSVYPKPVRESATVAFDSEGGHGHMLLFDTMGCEALRLLDRELPRRPQQLRLSASGRAAGSYYCHVREGSRSSGRLLAMEWQARHR